MAKKRDTSTGRFVSVSSQHRVQTMSFRATAYHSQVIKDVANSRGMTVADLIAEWADNGCPTSQSDSLDSIDLGHLKSKVLEDLQLTEKIGLQSSLYKKIKKAFDLFERQINSIKSK